MEQVDFYILGREDPVNKLKFACRISQKAYTQGLTVYLQTETREQSTRLDALLWTFSQCSFVPHTIADRPEGDWDDFPVQVGTFLDGSREADVLISLVEGVPETHSRFRRIVEVVADSPAEKAAGRKRFRYYLEQGIKPNTHHIA